jgi:hypothetical protein
MAGLPLFPLGNVLFPGGTIRLRIFERRYLDMVADCMRAGSGFGVCLIARGNEVGTPATPAAIGTLATIEDFATLPDGLLGIVARGSRRFRLTQAVVQPGGLLLGDVDWLDDDPAVPLPPEHGLLATLVERLGAQMDPSVARAPQSNYDDAAWVAWRLGELLPIEPTERLQLLVTEAPLARLALLADWIPRFQSP